MRISHSGSQITALYWEIAEHSRSLVSPVDGWLWLPEVQFCLKPGNLLTRLRGHKQTRMTKKLSYQLSLQPTLKCGLFNHYLEHPICHKQNYCWTVLVWVFLVEIKTLIILELSSLRALCVSCLSMDTSVWRVTEVWPGRESGQHWVTLRPTPRVRRGHSGARHLTQDTGPVSWHLMLGGGVSVCHGAFPGHTGQA